MIALALGAIATVALSAPTPRPSIAQCFADHGIQGVTVDSEGVNIPNFTAADNNAGQAWDAQIDRIYDECTQESDSRGES